MTLLFSTNTNSNVQKKTANSNVHKIHLYCALSMEFVMNEFPHCSNDTKPIHYTCLLLRGVDEKHFIILGSATAECSYLFLFVYFWLAKWACQYILQYLTKIVQWCYMLK